MSALRFACLLLATLFAGEAAAQCQERWPCRKCPAQGAAASDRLSPHQERFYTLDRLIEQAYKADDLATAAALAKEYVAMAETYRCDWNYGNAIHDGNRFLGLISLRTGDRTAAAAHLANSSKSDGSPQLNSFGPDLELANALLQAGDIEPVKAYLRDVKRFWEMDYGKVDRWLAGIEAGEKPELNRFAYQPSFFEEALSWLALAWPVLVVAGWLFWLKERIVRRGFFLLSGLVCGYAAMIAAWFATIFLLPRVLDGALISSILYIAVGASFLITVLAVFGISRLFVSRESPAA
jgi:hypothetical protein